MIFKNRRFQMFLPLFVVAYGLLTLTPAQRPPDLLDEELLWSEHYDSTSSRPEGTIAATLDQNGNLFVAGFTTGATTKKDIILVKYFRSGARQWVRTFNGSANDDDEPTAITTDSDGNILVTGYASVLVSGNVRQKCVTLKYSSNGTLLWSRVLNHGGDDNNAASRGQAIAVNNSSGHIYVTGRFTAYSNNLPLAPDDILTLRYSPDGNLRWEKRYDGTARGPDGGYAIALDSVGNVYITGYSEGGGTVPTGVDYITLKYGTIGRGDGRLLWEQRFDGERMLDVAVAIAIDEVNNVYVTGSARRRVMVDQQMVEEDWGITIKYDSSGTQLWISEARPTFGGGGLGFNHIAFGPMGELYVGGADTFGTRSGTILRGSRGVVMKYDPNTGTELWHERKMFGDGFENAFSYVVGLAVHTDGNVFVAGTLKAVAQSPKIVALKYLPDATEDWRYTHDLDSFVAEGRAAALDFCGNLYVTGTVRSSPSDNATQLAIVKYGHRPTANHDTYTVTDTAILTRSATSGVLANDSFICSPGYYSAQLVNAPRRGTLILQLDGSFTYIPSINFNSTDQFTYRATDFRTVSSNPTTVTLNAASMNDLPKPSRIAR